MPGKRSREKELAHRHKHQKLRLLLKHYLQHNDPEAYERLRQQAGLQPLNGGGTMANPAREAEILKLRKQGLTYSQISESLNLAPGTVSYYLKKNDAVGDKHPSVRKVKPIVYRAEQNGTGVLEELFSSLSQESKIAALKAVIEGRK
jgi:DNA-binding transcriptional ArsR family regulator